MNGFENTSTETLTVITEKPSRRPGHCGRADRGGIFHTAGAKGAAPPAQSGQLTLALLDKVTAELARGNATSPTPIQSRAS
ncbi:hypothetical protein FXF53_11480 [Micromonospora sp. WP24]|uniref:hypothetical protein n=1 Tax=Micromonospora sp. WP24 TaxID=2604469 RepID=UPI0011DAA7C2|nr:hypothetical protein [Micromonospora sp. WP24]TYC01677.1 hypothetical protein FXF53_11480 [Micromonospora sp. WP24]